jgi:hypothetical protein
MSEFLGSVWFGMMLALAGYLVGNVLPIGKLMDMFKSK